MITRSVNISLFPSQQFSTTWQILLIFDRIATSKVVKFLHALGKQMAKWRTSFWQTAPINTLNEIKAGLWIYITLHISRAHREKLYHAFNVLKPLIITMRWSIRQKFVRKWALLAPDFTGQACCKWWSHLIRRQKQ